MADVAVLAIVFGVLWSLPARTGAVVIPMDHATHLPRELPSIFWAAVASVIFFPALIMYWVARLARAAQGGP